MRALGLVALTVCGLAVAGCGGSDDEETAGSTTATAPAVTGAAPGPTDEPAADGDGTSGGAADGGTTTDGGTSGGTTTGGNDGSGDADDSLPSGGVDPSGGSGGSSGTAGGDQPTITPGTADTPASAITDDPTLIDLWCEQARQGAYNDQVGDATELAITVQGSDDTRICELPR